MDSKRTCLHLVNESTHEKQMCIAKFIRGEGRLKRNHIHRKVYKGEGVHIKRRYRYIDKFIRGGGGVHMERIHA